MSALSDKVVGFEANGGFLVGTPFTQGSRTLAPLPTRDAVLPVLAVLADARNQGCTVSELMLKLPRRYTYSDRLKDIPTSFSRDLLADLTANGNRLLQLMAPNGAQLASIDTIDGLRATFDTGEITHLRPSGNAPELRCYAEADTPERASALVREVLERVGAGVDRGQKSEIR